MKDKTSSRKRKQKFLEAVMENLDYNMQLFREMISCVHNIYCTEFDTGYEPIYSTAGEEDKWMLAGLFAMGNVSTDTPLSRRDGQYEGRPILCTNALGMAWISNVLIKEGAANKIYVLGPVFLDDFSLQKVERRMDYLQVSVLRKKEFMDVIGRLPVMPMMRFMEYGLMLHYCLYGEKLSIADYCYMEEKERADETGEQKSLVKKGNAGYQEMEGKSNHATYEMEQKLMRMVEDGNLDYKAVKRQLVSFGNVGKISNGDYLHEMRKHTMIHTALCTRAAIRGGLDPEIAYQLSDLYICNLEQCKTVEELTETNTAMMDDFVCRVHRLKVRAGVSPLIVNACEYINLNLEEDLDVHHLASRLGYADYYFSKKFKKEMGMSVTKYIQDKRLEKSCELLRNTNQNVQEISEILGFKTHSYFGKIFKEKMGVSPSEYRNGTVTKEIG